MFLSQRAQARFASHASNTQRIRFIDRFLLGLGSPSNVPSSAGELFWLTSKPSG
jgi:hypothetical protein